MGGWLDGSLGQWVGSGQITNYLINLDIIEIMSGCMGGWMDGQDNM